jgi:hypothetical protein
MAVLSSASTLAQVQAEYDDNASYAEDDSAAKCRRFITACRILMRRLPKQTGTREAQLELNAAGVGAELTKAEQWLQGKDTTDTAGGRPLTSRGSFRNFRD